MYGIQEAAERVGISEGLLILWISTKRIVPSIEMSTANSAIFDKYPALKNYAGKDGELLGWNRFVFTDEDVEHLRAVIETTAPSRSRAEKSHVAGAHYTPKELADLWALSVDTIRELFESEQGVIVIGHSGNRRKRGYHTLRIPESVAARVQRKLSNR